MAEPTQLSTRAAGPGDAGHRHDRAPYVERRHDVLPREPLRRLFPVASALSAVHRRWEIGEMRAADRRRIVDTLVQSCSPNLWGMGGSDRRQLCVSVIRFAGSPADLLKSVSNHTRPRADVRPGCWLRSSMRPYRCIAPYSVKEGISCQSLALRSKRLFWNLGPGSRARSQLSLKSAVRAPGPNASTKVCRHLARLRWHRRAVVVL